MANPYLALGHRVKEYIERGTLSGMIVRMCQKFFAERDGETLYEIAKSRFGDPMAGGKSAAQVLAYCSEMWDVTEDMAEVAGDVVGADFLLELARDSGFHSTGSLTTVEHILLKIASKPRKMAEAEAMLKKEFRKLGNRWCPASLMAAIEDADKPFGILEMYTRICGNDFLNLEHHGGRPYTNWQVEALLVEILRRGVEKSPTYLRDDADGPNAIINFVVNRGHREVLSLFNSEHACSEEFVEKLTFRLDGSLN